MRKLRAPAAILRRGDGIGSVLLTCVGMAAWKTICRVPWNPQPRLPFRVSLPGFRGYMHLLSDELGAYYNVQVDDFYDFDPAFVLRPHWIVLELGAHIGTYSITRGRLLDKARGGHMYAFEPQPAVYELLRRNIALNHLEDTVTPVPLAVYSSEGEESFVSSRYTTAAHIEGTGNVASPSHRRLGQARAVRTTTLDRFVEAQGLQRIHLLKLNIEGAEHAALLGGRERALAMTERVLLSHESGLPPGDIFAALAEHGLLPVGSRACLLMFARKDPGTDGRPSAPASVHDAGHRAGGARRASQHS